ncbi:MAG: septum formation protein Maf [Candidatus Thermoplasmatota archaeon]|nr:septum formation protein Maf [Candidatus Thermoplasmatota archaeon]
MGLVLASGSPRRKDLLKEAGINFVVRAPAVEESVHGEPKKVVVSNARAKARSVTDCEGGIILGADTVVVCNGEVMGKPGNEKDACRMLELELGNPQTVITGVCVIDVSTGREFTGYEISKVVMDGAPSALREHLKSGQWEGKAGAYGLQDNGPLKARVIEGNEDNVVGLPMTLVRRLLSLLGFEYAEKTPAGE